MTATTAVSKSTERLVRATGVVVAFVLILAAATLWITAQGKSGIDAQRRSDEITACRSEYRAPIDQADAELERARTDLARTEGDQADTFNAGLVAAVQGDDSTLAELVERYPQQRAAVQAERVKVATAQDEKTTAADAYSTAVRLSRTDPERFLKGCRRLAG